MKKNSFSNYILVAAILVLSSFGVWAQTEQQVAEITRNYNTSFLQHFAQQSIEKSTLELEEAIQHAKANNLPVTYTTEDGTFMKVRKVLPDGTLMYYTTYNADAARSTRADVLHYGGITGLNLEGQDMIAHVWDGGHPRISHQEYDGPGGNNRVSIMDSPLDMHEHSAHVAGTIMASGVQAQAKGMAPRAKVHAYQWDDDVAEAAVAAQQGMLVSNHSYGINVGGIFGIGWLFNGWMGGAYIEESRDWDELLFNAPNYLMVVAAGNDGGITGMNTSAMMSGYDMLAGHSTSKNNLVVAAAEDANIDSNGNLIAVELASFSSPGPTDDLRIKPDITGNGVDVYSTVVSNDNAYDTMSGTSMASPDVAGTLLLLQEHYNNVNGNFMRAATLKGLALHTADEFGGVGPDAKTGWGLLNAKRAAETISQNGTNAIIDEMTLNNGETITFEVDSDGLSALQVSISWTDRAGEAKVGTTPNVSTPVLVNDLDVRVTQGNTTYYPWRLTAANANSNNGDNIVDPYERIDVENASGTYTVTITHKGTLVGGNQAFSVIVTGIEQPTQSADYVYENGFWTPEHPNLSATANNNILVVNGTADGSDAIYNPLDIGEIHINQGATLEIESVLNVHGDLTIEGDLIFKSGEDFDGELGIMSGTISGEATIHRYMSQNRAYRMVSSAVTTTSTIRDNWQEGVNNPDTNTNYNPNPGFGTHITGSDPNKGFDVTQTGNPSLYSVDVPSQMFVAVDNTNQNTLNAGDAYLLFVRGDRSIDLNDPTNSAANETILRTKGALYQGEKMETYQGVAAGDFIMFGNPYQSTLDVEMVLNTSDNANTNHYHVYDPTLGTRGAYVTVNLLSGGNNTSGSEANQYLQPGQAAQYATVSSGATYLIIEEDHKAPGEHTHTSFQGYDNMLTVQLFTTENYNAEGSVHDSFGMVFDDSFDNNLTPVDAIKPFNFYENMGIDHDGTYLSLEYRQMPQEVEEYQLYTSGYAHEAYTLKLMVDGLENSAIYLEDHYTGEITLLEGGEVAYNFTVDQGEPLSMATDRFTIRTENVLGVPNNDLFANISLYPNPTSDNTFYINAPQLNGKSVDVTITDLGGRTIYTKTLDFDSNQITVSTATSLASGVYLVTMEHDGAMHTFKLVKK